MDLRRWFAVFCFAASIAVIIWTNGEEIEMLEVEMLEEIEMLEEKIEMVEADENQLFLFSSIGAAIVAVFICGWMRKAEPKVPPTQLVPPQHVHIHLALTTTEAQDHTRMMTDDSQQSRAGGMEKVGMAVVDKSSASQPPPSQSSASQAPAGHHMASPPQARLWPGQPSASQPQKKRDHQASISSHAGSATKAAKRQTRACKLMDVSAFCDDLRKLCLTPGIDEEVIRAKIDEGMTKFEGVENSIFQVLTEDAIFQMISGMQNLLFADIMKMADVFLEATSNDNFKPTLAVQDVVINADSLLSGVVPWIMDQSCREPATSTPFGQTAWTKYLTFQIMRRLNFTDIAICGLYYKDQPTPECLFLELLRQRNESMDGTIAMFGPFQQDREVALRLMKEYKIPNAFFDLTLKPSGRFASSVDPNDPVAAMNFVQEEVLAAVVEVDRIFQEQGLIDYPWRSDEDLSEKRPCMGEITINFVDIMEFLKPHNDQRRLDDEDAFSRLAETVKVWQKHPVFAKRVVGILTEEGRGVANVHQYAYIVERLRGLFPSNTCRIAIHCHAGTENVHDAAPIDCLTRGANGIWAAFIPQAAQNGHNNSFTFLDTLMRNGNKNAWWDFKLEYGVKAAQQLYYLNFNSVQIPSNCPIWGARQTALVHSAFDTTATGPEKWQSRAPRLYKACFQNKYEAELTEIAEGIRKRERARQKESKASFDLEGEYRIAALVSDDLTWFHRLQELKLCQDARDEARVPIMRRIAYAVMNANIRANFNDKDVLRLLLEQARLHGKSIGNAAASSKVNH